MANALDTIKVIDNNGTEYEYTPPAGLKCEVQEWTGNGNHTFTKTGAVAYVAEQYYKSSSVWAEGVHVKIGGVILAPSVTTENTRYIASSSVIGSKPRYLCKEVA